jgi:tRNA A-37 threonylcarbamoyl transferase component Bud32
MTPAFWDRVRVLFEAAIEETPEDLTTWLREREPEDEALRREVESLLAHHSRAGSFLETSAAGLLLETLDEDDSILPPGTCIGPYAIVREIGRGGMGRVYEASDTRLGRAVAIKALPPHATRDPIARERLRREARAAARLSHPGICTVYALEEREDEVFLVCEYLEGRTLREEIDAGERPSPDAVAHTAAEVASALAAAHAQEIVHRDLKPANIIRTTDGRVKILDFGLARATTSSRVMPSLKLTQPGTIAGTPAAMAPEQIDGRPSDVRTDIFALGVVLYELATGIHPFAGDTPIAVMGRVLEAEPRPISTLRPDLPPAIAEAIQRCLHKVPGDRYQSADELLAALRQPRQRSVGNARARFWWRTHQAVMLVLYFLVVAAAWQMKEWQKAPVFLWLFLATAALATAAGVLRGHLLFTERTDPAHLADQHLGEGRIIMAVDLTIAALAFGAALFVSSRHPVASALAIGLTIGIGLATLTIEPATTRAAFERIENRE